MSKEMILEKIEQAVKILQEKDIDMWLIFVRESSNIRDPSMDMVAGTNCTWQSAFILTRDGDTTSIVGSLDVANIKVHGIYKNVIGYVNSVKQPLIEELERVDPKKIAINYSRDSSLADGLTHGMYLELTDHLKDTPYLERLVSSEDIINALRGRKSPAEISIMKEVVQLTLDIFDEATKFIKAGVTESQIAEYMRGIVKERGFGLSWDAGYCPSVFTGPDTAGAHATPTDKQVQQGHVLNIDFGISYKGYCSDLQRTWYILRDGEEKAPEEVQRGFDVIKESIQLSARAIKPGKHGCDIDDVARSYIVNHGYEEYPHALGHQIGRMAHDGGGLLAPRWDRYGSLPFKPIEVNEVYTIEPRLSINGFGIATIEEEVIVTEDGCEFISFPQQEIILIKPHH
ncbi:MAG: Xaa-Pro peptidase family protein [Ignavibacteria bacterium]